MDLGPDSLIGSHPSHEAACLAAKNVPPCDIFTPSTSVTAAPGSQPLVRVEVKSGQCVVRKSPTVEGDYSVGMATSGEAFNVGDTCELLVTLKDGNQQTVRVIVVERILPPQCCGYPLPPYPGQWVSVHTKEFSPDPVVIHGVLDGGLASSG